MGTAEVTAEEATTATPMPATAAPIVSALEGAWNAIREHHPEVPHAFIIVGSGQEDRRKAINGHWANSRWVPQEGGDADSRLGEVFIAGERIGDGADCVIETLLHEAAHGLADARKIEDTSQKGAYHNGKYKALAEELLLVVSKGRKGWNETDLSDGARVRYAAEIERLERALAYYRVAGTADSDDKPKKPKRIGRVTFECGCPEPRKMLMVPAQAIQAETICRKCDSMFVDRSGKLAEWWLAQAESNDGEPPMSMVGDGVDIQLLMSPETLDPPDEGEEGGEG